jgi:hypothetical protein
MLKKNRQSAENNQISVYFAPNTEGVLDVFIFYCKHNFRVK